MAEAGKIPIAWALGISLALHAALIAGPVWRKDNPERRPSAAALAATLKAPPEPVAAPREAPPLFLPREPRLPRSATPAKTPLPAPAGRPRPAAAPLREAMAQVAERLLYPPEAIARGLEGEVLVLVFLDESGTAVAARVERGSGHRILDEAAVAAARGLRSLPAETPREALLPVRFRLN